MSLNCREIDAVLAEIDIIGSFIQQIVQPTYDSLALYTYKAGDAKTILICLAPGACRLHETRRRIPKNDKPLRFMEMLRSRIKGCRIEAVEQPGGERIVRFTLKRDEQHFFLYARLWSGAANILLTDENGLISDVFFRRPKRGEVSGGIYLPDFTPSAATKEWFVRDFAELPDAARLTFNERVEAWYTLHAQVLSREALLEQAQKQFHSRQSRMEAALEKLEAKRESFLHADRWRHMGDLLLSNAHSIVLPDEQKKSGKHFAECLDYETGSPVSIEIDGTKSAKENALHYYERYKKAVSGLTELENDITQAKQSLAKLVSVYEELQNEQNPLVIQQKMRKQATPRQQLEKMHPGLSFEVNGWRILVGRTAAENDELLRRHVKGQDTWLHTRDWAGGYVFVKNRPGKSVPLEILLDAGNLALFYSKGRKAQKADVYCTRVKYLRRAKNAPKGTVLPSNEKNLYIVLDDSRLKRLENSTAI